MKRIREFFLQQGLAGFFLLLAMCVGLTLGTGAWLNGDSDLAGGAIGLTVLSLIGASVCWVVQRREAKLIAAERAEAKRRRQYEESDIVLPYKDAIEHGMLD